MAKMTDRWLRAAVAAPFGRALFAAAPDFKFPTEPRARLGVASYPFRAFIESICGTPKTFANAAASVPLQSELVSP